MTKLKAVVIGDAMIPCTGFKNAFEKHLGKYGEVTFADDFEPNWDSLQKRRLIVEQQGPEVEPCDPLILEHGKDANILTGLFIACSSKVMEAMPDLKIIGVSRAGIENVNVEEATKRGILVFNVMGRNAHAVSDYAIGMMLAETRNIARAYKSIKEGSWRKTFSNSDTVPEMHDKTIGIIGFGYIGKLVAKKLSGFDCRIVVYDPFVDEETIKNSGCEKVDLETLFKTSDIVSVHARLSEKTKGMITKELIDSMKSTAYFINTARSGLVDYDALADALKEKRIAGAALDVFNEEPISETSPFLDLDNVTLTTHLAGTTSEALSNSPYLLSEDIARLFNGEEPKFIINREVLENPEFKKWLDEVRQ